MAKPWEILYTEGHRYPRSRRTGGKEKSELEWRKYWKEKAEKLQKENIILKDKLKLAQMELKILHLEYEYMS